MVNLRLLPLVREGHGCAEDRTADVVVDQALRPHDLHIGNLMISFSMTWDCAKRPPRLPSPPHLSRIAPIPSMD